MGFILVVGTSLVPYRCFWRRRLVYLTGLLYGGLLGWARIVQGGHFLSDSICAGALMCLLVAGLQATVLRHNTPHGEGGSGRPGHV